MLLVANKASDFQKFVTRSWIFTPQAGPQPAVGGNTDLYWGARGDRRGRELGQIRHISHQLFPRCVEPEAVPFGDCDHSDAEQHGHCGVQFALSEMQHVANRADCWLALLGDAIPWVCWDASDVIIEGDNETQEALRFAVYHLNSAANPVDERVSVGARALTGDAYFGHVFWDTEIYLLPFYTAVWPEAARAMLMYRYHTLPAARAKAAHMGCKGAQYAWESANTG